MNIYKTVLLAVLFLFSHSVSSRERIITIGGDVSEIVYALGVSNQIVARDTSSIYPFPLTVLPDIGYMRRLNSEGLLSMRPSLIIASEQAKPSLALEQVRRTGVHVALISGQSSLDAIPLKIRTIAALLQQKEKGELLIRTFNHELMQIKTNPLPIKVLFILTHSGGMTPMAAGQNTAADNIIRATGGKNAMQGFNGFRPLSTEGVIASKPDLILITQLGLKSLKNENKLWQLPGLKHTPAGIHKRLLIIEDVALLSFGLRTPAAMQKLRQAMELQQ